MRVGCAREQHGNLLNRFSLPITIVLPSVCIQIRFCVHLKLLLGFRLGMGEMAFAKSLSGMSPEHKIIAGEMATCEKLKETTSVDNVTKFRHKRLPRNVFCHCWEPCPPLERNAWSLWHVCRVTKVSEISSAATRTRLWLFSFFYHIA